jgi:hypothetical protein
MIITPTTLIALSMGSGHLEHLNPEDGWYLVPLIIWQSLHSRPSYPDVHSTGYSFSGLYPPIHPLVFGHSIITDEFCVNLQ